MLFYRYVMHCLFTHGSVQLCYKYNLAVTFCCSGATVVAVCDDFHSVLFSLK